LAGIIVSSLSCLALLFYLFKLAALELRDERRATRAILYLAVYPVAFFLLAVYSESVFLAATTAAFFYARCKRWSYTGIAALLAGLTSHLGFLLIVPIGWEAYRELSKLGWRWTLNTFASVLAALAAPVASLFWALLIGWRSNDLFVVLHSREQTPFFRRLSIPLEPVIAALQSALQKDLVPWVRASTLIELSTVVLMILVAIACWRAKLPSAYGLYCSAATFLLLCQTIPDWPLQSMPPLFSSAYSNLLVTGQDR
jgi:hypothetical protein